MGTQTIALWLGLIAVALSTAAYADGGAAGFRHGCIGDCNDDLRVTVDELILSVRIQLEEAPESACPNGGQGSIEGLTTSVLNTMAGCIGERDFSGFGQFQLSQDSALGFCPEVGDLYSANIRSTANGVVLARSLIEQGALGVDECLFGGGPFIECAVARALPCRSLTATELERVRAAFAAVRLWTAPDAFCLHGVVDPCLITDMQWDDFSTTDYIHQSDRLDAGEVTRIADVLRALGEGPETPCPDGP